MGKFGTAIILAGGRSSRMGYDKQLLELDGKRIIDYIIDQLFEEFDQIIVSTNRPDYYSRTDILLVGDILESKGPLSGIHAGLTKARSKYSFVIACDMPNINFAYIKYMKDHLKKDSYKGIITKKGKWIEPFYSFYSKDLIKNIEENIKENRKSVFPLVENNNFLIIEEREARKFSPNWEIFENLNTTDDFNRFKNELRADS